MKKSIASLAMLVSASAVTSTGAAMPLPPGAVVAAPEPVTYCLSVIRVEDDGSAKVDSCDASVINTMLKREILKSGCAADQVAMITYDKQSIKACAPPGFAQL